MRFASIAPDATVHHDFLLVLHGFFSPNFDSEGNVHRLRHLIGTLDGLGVQVAGDEAGHALALDDVRCYRGSSGQGVDGPGVPMSNESVMPAFSLADGDFDFAYGRDNTYYDPDDDRLSPASDFGTGCS